MHKLAELLDMVFRLEFIDNIQFYMRDQAMPKIHKTVDARGLNCPMPVTKSMQAIKKMRIGQVLEILTTDPGSKKDIPIWAKATKQELLSFKELGSESYRFLVKKLK
jgi:tRNA 2-thiouridine synthesizing protein A